MLAESKLNKQMLDSFLSFYSTVKGRDLETKTGLQFFFYLKTLKHQEPLKLEVRTGTHLAANCDVVFICLFKMIFPYTLL